MDEISPINENSPLKIVILGASAVGKSTFANNLNSQFFRETYYPTHSSTVLLFEFKPNSAKVRSILDEYGGLEAKQKISKDGQILLSPVIFQSYTRLQSVEKPRRGSFTSGFSGKLKNNYYTYKFISDEKEKEYTEPLISPISIELIDTPAFKPHLVVPFLEVSLYRNLDKEDLYNLANEPRRPVSTNPLLVASGASELDGNVGGYIFMYSAVPTLNPPSYDEVLSPVNSNSSIDISDLTPKSSRNNEDSLGVLELIRGAIFDAWKEYRTYQKKWKEGSEGDVYSLIYGIKQLWKMKNIEEEHKKIQELRKISSHLEDLKIDPVSPESPPPIIVVCTHAKHDGSSPILIENGKKLANNWKSSFILIDNETNENVEEALALMIREIVEKEKLQKMRKKLRK